MFGLKNKAEVRHRFESIYFKSHVCAYKNNYMVSLAAVLAISFSSQCFPPSNTRQLCYIFAPQPWIMANSQTILF